MRKTEVAFWIGGSRMEGWTFADPKRIVRLQTSPFKSDAFVTIVVHYIGANGKECTRRVHALSIEIIP